MSLSPNLPSPPVILPHQAAQQNHRTTNFFIDNILRPDFGCRKEPSYRSQTPGRENVNPLTARPHTGSLCLDSSSDSTSSSSPSSSSPSSSPSSKQSNKQGEAAGTGTGTGRYADSNGGSPAKTKDSQGLLWPAWVYCTRYSDRPSSGKALIVPESHRRGCVRAGELCLGHRGFFHGVVKLLLE